MRANKKEGGRAERLLGQMLWERGLRYRKHYQALPGKPDFVFVGARVCVFCDGDFWHGRDWERLRALLEQRANAEYWVAKIARNRERDAEQTQALELAGWIVLRLWETDVLKNPSAIARCVEMAISNSVARLAGR